MKFIKVSIFTVAALIMIALLVGGVFIASFDGNKYKAMISEQVKQHTGRDMTLGNIKLSLFPWPGLDLRQLTLSNAKGFDAQQMVKIDSLDVHFELMALLKWEIKVDTVRVHGLQLSLEKNKRGKTNWDDILQKLQSANTVSGPGEQKTPADIKPVDEKPAIAILINGVDFKNANIQWLDASTGQSILLQQLNLEAGVIRPGQSVPLNLSTKVKLSEPEASIKLNMQMQLEYDPKSQQLKLHTLDMNVDVKAQSLNLDQAKIKLKTQLNADLKKQIFILPKVSLNIDVKSKVLPNKKIQADIETDININLEKQSVDINNLNIQTIGLELRSQLTISRLLDAPQAKGKITLHDFNPRKLAKTLAIELPAISGKQVLKSASMVLDFSANENAIRLKPVMITLDQSTINGELSIRQFEKPIIRYQLALDQINLDHYLPPLVKPTKKSTKVSVAATKKADTPINLPQEILKTLNIKGELGADVIQVSGQTISNLTITTVAKDGLIALPKLKAKVLGGKINSSAQLDVRANVPRYKLKVNATGLKADSIVNPILQSVLGEKTVGLKGVTSLNLNVHSKGQSVNQLIANSNGQLKLNMGKAILQGVDAEYFVRKVVIKYIENKKQAIPQTWKGEYRPKETTALKMARASAKITNGVIENKDLLLDSARFKITGAGKINLAKEKLNYRMVIDINPPTTKTLAQRLLDIPMPVFVKGNFTQPKISIDSKAWSKSVGKELKAEVKKEIKQAIKKQKKKQKEKLKNKLKNLFKR